MLSMVVMVELQEQHAFVPPTEAVMGAGEADAAQRVGFLMYPCHLPCFFSAGRGVCS